MRFLHLQVTSARTGKQGLLLSPCSLCAIDDNKQCPYDSTWWSSVFKAFKTGVRNCGMTWHNTNNLIFQLVHDSNTLVFNCLSICLDRR